MSKILFKHEHFLCTAHISIEQWLSGPMEGCMEVNQSDIYYRLLVKWPTGNRLCSMDFMFVGDLKLASAEKIVFFNSLKGNTRARLSC